MDGRISAALDAFCAQSGQQVNNAQIREIVVDMITDLLHVYEATEEAPDIEGVLFAVSLHLSAERASARQAREK